MDDWRDVAWYVVVILIVFMLWCVPAEDAEAQQCNQLYIDMKTLNSRMLHNNGACTIAIKPDCPSALMPHYPEYQIVVELDNLNEYGYKSYTKQVVIDVVPLMSTIIVDAIRIDENGEESMATSAKATIKEGQ